MTPPKKIDQVEEWPCEKKLHYFEMVSSTLLAENRQFKETRDRLAKENQVMREALEFYADENKYFFRTIAIDPKSIVFPSKYNEETGECEAVDVSEMSPHFTEAYECTARLKIDQGKTAREALKKLGEA